MPQVMTQEESKLISEAIFEKLASRDAGLIKEAEDAIDELLKRAGDEFQEFIERCLEYEPDDDEELSWFI